MKNKQTRKRLFNILFFLIFAIATIYIIFRNNDINRIMANIKGSHKEFLFGAVLCMFVYLFAESFNVYRLLKTLNDKVSIWQTLKYSFIGFFFSSITPSSTGGQPMQLYFMNKDKISISHGALALLVQLLSFQFITLVLALIGFGAEYDLLIHHIGNIKYLMFLGIGVNLVIQTFLIIMIFSKNLGKKLINLATKILRKFKYKKLDNFQKKALEQLEDYHDCAYYLKKHKLLLIQIIFVTLIQMSAYHAVPYFVYKAFGLSGSSILTFIFLQAVLYISVASLPLPGAMGASEGSFMIIFKMLFPAAFLSSAMVLSRGISFYLYVIISALVIVGFMLKDKLKVKN